MHVVLCLLSFIVVFFMTVCTVTVVYCSVSSTVETLSRYMYTVYIQCTLYVHVYIYWLYLSLCLFGWLRHEFLYCFLVDLWGEERVK